MSVAGIRAAHAAGDRPLAGHAISSLEYQLANTGDARTAVVLARSAFEGARGRATVATEALLLERVAWAHARAGELAQTERALDAVDRGFERFQMATSASRTYIVCSSDIETSRRGENSTSDTGPTAAIASPQVILWSRAATFRSTVA